MAINKIGSRIKAARKEKKLTLKEVSNLANISISFLSDIENGRSNPSLDRTRDIAKALDVSVSFLLGEQNNPTNAPQPNKNDTDLSKGDLNKIEKDLEQMMEAVKRDPNEGYAAYDGETEIDENDLEYELLEDAFRTALKIVKKLNKETYTPNKYRKNNK
jgi:transcriptional regulator with XRE-family HTH domain